MGKEISRKRYGWFKSLKKGRPPKVGVSTDIMLKNIIKSTPTEQEELKLLRERNKYLEAENLYLKKLRALEFEKTAKLAKAKKKNHQSRPKRIQMQHNCSSDNIRTK